MLEILSPGWLADVEGVGVRVGGRVVESDAWSCRVADALGSVAVSFASPTETHPGDLVIVEGRLNDARLLDASLIERHAHALPAAGDFLRFAGGGVGRRLLARAQAEAVVREYFDAQRFIEVRTPLRVPCPGTDVYVEPFQSEEQWLITSPEAHMKRLLVGGFPRIFQFASVLRREESGPWHQPEFTLLEWYRSFADVESVMRDTEELVCRVAERLGGGALRVADTAVPTDTVIATQAPFERRPVAELFREFAQVDDATSLAAEDEDRYFQIWVDQVDPALRRLPRPVFVTEFPVTQAALARPSPSNPKVAERFELFVAGVELCNGYGELNDSAAQRQRFQADVERRKAKGLREIPIDEALLKALVEGMPPSAGNALGFERLLALCLGVSLAEVTAFPAEHDRLPE